MFHLVRASAFAAALLLQLLPTSDVDSAGNSTNAGDGTNVSTRMRANAIDNAQLVFVPAGEFTMGNDESFSDARPRHRVYLDGFWMYQTPVTVRQYRRFCATTGSHMPPAPSSGWHDDDPIVNVSWNDAAAYCRWANVALPTEAQWEKAARGPAAHTYPWGDVWDSRRCANSVDVPRSVPAPVGSYPEGVSRWGALDMVGNVAQWCADWYAPDAYKGSAARNPRGPQEGIFRVVRGGSWRDADPSRFVGFYRYRRDPASYNPGVGFRPVINGRL